MTDAAAETTAPSSAAQSEDIAALIGTWDHELDDSGAQTLLDDFSGLVEDADTVVVRLAFVDDDEWWLGFLFDGERFLLEGAPEGDGGTYAVEGDRMTMVGAHIEARVNLLTRVVSTGP